MIGNLDAKVEDRFGRLDERMDKIETEQAVLGVMVRQLQGILYWSIGTCVTTGIGVIGYFVDKYIGG